MVRVEAPEYRTFSGSGCHNLSEAYTGYGVVLDGRR
jgi:hypothetical protein